jgi:hypothetical protein
MNSLGSVGAAQACTAWAMSIFARGADRPGVEAHAPGREGRGLEAAVAQEARRAATRVLLPEWWPDRGGSGTWAGRRGRANLFSHENLSLAIDFRLHV